MRQLLILLVASALATPALAQHQGHTMPMPPKAAPAPKATPKAAPQKVAAKKAAPKKTVTVKAKKTSAKAAPTKKTTKPAPNLAPEPAMPPTDPHAGHSMQAPPQVPSADTHAGHDIGVMDVPAPAPAVAPPPPRAFTGPENAADAVYGAEVMKVARDRERDEHGNIKSYRFMVDQLETQIRNGRDGYYWEALAWYGGDINKLWVTTEGEGTYGESPEQAEVQVLYSRALDPWFNLQAGVRHDFYPDPQRSHLVLGVEGLAPYWFDVTGAAFLSNKGDVTARFEGEYDQRLTQKLILQPRLEFNLAAQDIPEIGVGSGLVNTEASLRLRYEIVPEFAPYIGVAYERAFGDTADFLRAAGERAGSWSFVLGVRTWF